MNDLTVKPPRRWRYRASLIGLCLFIVLSAVSTYRDVHPYFAAVKHLSGYAGDFSMRIHVAVDDQPLVGMFTSCRDLRQAPDVRFDRTCLLHNLPLIQDHYIALIGLQVAAQYLRRHPDDKEVQDAAIRAIEIARADLLKEKPRYDAMSAAVRAQSQSFILTGFHPREDRDFDEFKVFADMLTRLEFEIRAPATASVVYAFYDRAKRSSNTTP